MQTLPRYTALLLLIGWLAGAACSSPKQTPANDPADPAADSVADGLILSDTTVVDDDTLEVALPVQPKINK
ncbi:hypothetical protein ACAW74_19635 [Fibrella sp. WM1]|uniref:hypothetical protein n=1 Tax=Fibrella musci TaxID=3242485 RepID=UPI0035230674